VKNRIVEMPSRGEIVIYKTKDRKIQLNVRLEEETVWKKGGRRGDVSS
jgi:hypothetical protein